MGDARLHARVPSGAFGGWARKLDAGSATSIVGFDPASAVYYGDDDARIAGHVDVDAAAPTASGSDA